MPANAANPGGGTLQAPGPPSMLAVLQSIVDACNKSVSPTKPNGDKKSCTTLGADKHACCDKAIEDHQAKNPPNGDPPLEGERGYRRPELIGDPPAAVRPLAPLMPTGGARPNLGAAFAAGGSAVGAAFAALRGNCFPDAAILNADGSRTFVDFKFPCPPDHPSGKGTSAGGRRTDMSPRQKASYDALGEASGNGAALIIRPT